MNEWIVQSIDLIGTTASVLTAEPILYIVVAFILIYVCRLYKALGG